MMQRLDRKLDRCINHFQHRTCCSSFCLACRGLCPTITGMLIFPLTILVFIVTLSQSSLLQRDFQSYVSNINTTQSCEAYCGNDRSYPGSVSTDCCRVDGLSCIKKSQCYMQRANDFNMELMLYGTTIIIVGAYEILYIGYYAIRIAACLDRCGRPVMNERRAEDNEVIQALIRRRRNGVSRLPASETVESSEQICSICLGGYQDSKAIRLKCQHVFHDVCIRQWMIQSSKCPLCRTVT